MLTQNTNVDLQQFTVVERAVLYARVSGDDRKYATSGIEGQLDDCRKYAQDKGYNVIREFYETPNKHTSGNDWLPELESILALAEQQVFDVLIVRELDRLARNRFKQMSVENRLESLGLRVEYVLGQYENSSEGKLLKGLMGEFAEYERNKIKDRVVRGRVKAVQAGRILTGGSYAPFGYDLIDKQLVINEYEAETVRLIFDLYAIKGYGLHTIANYLNNHQIPTPAKGANHKANVNKSKKSGWHISTLGRILGNEVYIGKWYYRKKRYIKNPKTGKRMYVPRPKKDWLLIEVPAIIHEDTFKAVQKRREENHKQRGKQHKNFYLLGGMIKCGCCGYSMTGHTVHGNGKAYSYYKCPAKYFPNRYRVKCKNSSFSAKKVDSAIWEWIKSILMDEKHLNDALNKYQKAQLENQQPIIKFIEANQGKLAELDAQKTRLIDAYTAGILDLNEMASKKNDLDNQIVNLNEAIKALQSELSPSTLTQQNIDEIHAFAAKIRQGLKVADKDIKARRKIVQLLQVKVVLSEIDGEKRADVRCLLENERLSTEFPCIL